MTLQDPYLLRFGHTNLRKIANRRAILCGGSAIIGGLLGLSSAGRADIATTNAADTINVPMAHGGPSLSNENPGPGPKVSPLIEWKAQVTSDQTPLGLAVVDDLILVPGLDRTFYAIDTKTGAERWRFTAAKSSASTAPAAENGTAWVGMGNVLFAVDLHQGVEKWQKDFGEGDFFSDSSSRLTSVSKVLTAINGTLFLHAMVATTAAESDYPTVMGTLHALAGETGEELWQFETTNADVSWSCFCPVSPVAVADGVVFVTGFPSGSRGEQDGVLFAVDESTGVERWRMTIGSGVGALAIGKGSIFVALGDGSLLVVDAAIGTESWRTPAGSGPLDWVGVADGVVYVPMDHPAGETLLALSIQEGTELWRIDLDSAMFSMAIADGVVYFGDQDGSAYAVDSSSGRGLWRLSVSSEPVGALAVLGGLAFVSSWDGSLTALTGT